LDAITAVRGSAVQEEALARSVDAIVTVLDECIRTRRPIPAAKTSGALTVEIPVLEAAKVALYDDG